MADDAGEKKMLTKERLDEIQRHMVRWYDCSGEDEEIFDHIGALDDELSKLRIEKTKMQTDLEYELTANAAVIEQLKRKLADARAATGDLP